MTLGVVLAMMAVSVRPASADATAFIGANTSPANRQVRGFGIGMGLLIVVGLEFEYSNTTDDLAASAPSLKIGSGNGPAVSGPDFGVQPYSRRAGDSTARRSAPGMTRGSRPIQAAG